MRIRIYYPFVTIGIAFLFLSSCVKEAENTFETLFIKGEGYFILNEGAFGQGNASVSYYNQVRDTMIHHIFEQVNGKKLGDVLQSMTIYNEKGYLVINNSGYIKIVNPGTFEELGTIEGFTSPRHILPVSENEAFVSDLYANKIWIVDLASQTISDSIEIPGWTEEMVQVDGYVFVTSPSLSVPSSEVYVIDIASRTLDQTLHLKVNPTNIILDPNKNLQIFCLGDAFAEPKIVPSFHTINPALLEERSSFNMPGIPVAWSGAIALNATGQKMYISYGSIFEADILDFGLSWANVPFIEAAGSNFYGVSTDPVNGNILVLDAKDFNQNGSLLEYKPNGNFVSEKTTGVAPSKIVFY